MALLAVKNLTIRFGGLTAVNGFDCAVDQRQIFSVIGPNGAGKTTAFNAISGIYEPTSGAIEFAGQPLQRPIGWQVWLAAVAIGVATALTLLLATVNVDRLWQASIKRNYAGPGQPFSYRAAWQGARSYLAGRLQTASVRGGRWSVVTADGRRTLAYAGSLAEAETARDGLNLLIDRLRQYPALLTQSAAGAAATNGPSSDTGDVSIVATADGVKYVLPDGASETVLAEYRSPAEARGALDTLAAIGRERAVRKRLALAALPLGFCLGLAGTWVVWNRSRRTPDFIARAGIARTFQNIRLFQNLTVLENVLIGMDRQFKAGVWRMALRTPALRREEATVLAAANKHLQFVGLESRAQALAKNLSYGEQRRLEIARALASEPRLLLLDEPAAGMNPAESAELARLIEAIRARGLAVLLIEHHMRVVMGISDRIAVLDYGCKIAEGTPAEIRVNPAVIKAYLGCEEVT